MKHRQTDKDQSKGTDICSVADREVETGEKTGQVKLIGAEQVIKQAETHKCRK